MNYLKASLILYLFLVMLPPALFSQDQPVEIRNVNFYFDPEGNEMIITYDLANHSPLELYEVELIFIDGMNVVTRPVSITGDIGKGIQGGENKRIVWTIFDDVESLSETARPVVQIVSINNKPIDPDLAIIMDQISQEEGKKYHFKMQRDGVLIGGIGCGVAAVLCKLKADRYIEDQSNSGSIEEYNQAGDNADKYYAISYALGGVSVVAVGFSAYQYIRDAKSKKRKTAFVISPGLNQGICFSFTRRF